MNSTTIDELVKTFDDKLESIQLGMKLRNLNEAQREACDEWMGSLIRDVMHLKNLFGQVRKEIEQGKEDLEAIEAMTDRVIDHIKKVDLIRGKVPKHLPKKEDKKVDRPVSNKEKEKHSQEADGKIAHESKPKSISLTRSVLYLSKEEFESIPKYMRGRITYAAMNEAVADYNRAIAKKYQLLNKPRETIGHFEMKVYKTYKLQATKELAGVSFCSREDLRKFNSFKFDNSSKSIMCCLRHVGRTFDVTRQGTIFHCIK